MKNSGFIVVILFGAAALSCKVDPNKAFKEAVLKYKKGESQNFSDLEKYFIKSVSDEELLISDYEIDGNILFTQSRGHLNIFLPVKKKFILQKNIKVKSLDVNDKYGVISSGKKIYLYNSEDEYKVFNPKNPGEIEQVLIYGNRIIYFSDMKTYYFNVMNRRSEMLVNKNFKPPYEKFYKVYLFKDAHYLGILLGTAGIYNLSIVDLKKEALIKENMRLSSYRLFFNNGTIYYLEGSAGQWKLVKYDLKKGSKDVLTSFDDIIDIIFTPDSVMIEKKKGIVAYNYNGLLYNTPFKYRLSGVSGNNIILKYKTVTYIADTDNVNMKLKQLNDELPGIFR